MKNKEQLLNKENWIQYLNLADDGGLTNNAKANDIVSKIKQAINFIPCCTDLPILPRCKCMTPDSTEIKVFVCSDGYVV